MTSPKVTTRFITPLAVALLTAVAAPAQAQSIDLTTALPNVQFPKEGAFTASEAAKKLPGEERTGVQEPRLFLLDAPRSLGFKAPEIR
ncbi:MAG: hypothetical protein AAFY73_09300 [Pseudomonadota bacterium]